MNQAPFVYGRIATSPNFTNRIKEISLLKTNFKTLVNTIILSPRRWGKSSLVRHVTKEMAVSESGLRFCHIDLFNIRTIEEFYLALAKEVLQSTSSRWEESIQNARRFLSRLVPRISFSPDNQNEISFGVSWEDLKKNPDDILDLAQNIALAKQFNIVICIDEFQNIGEFDDPVAFQKKLRAHWQLHDKVAYCLYGSKKHMLLEVFSDSSMPFYKFGQLIFLKKIEVADWIPFITERFSSSGKLIGESEASLIAELTENHPYYVQQLAQQVWLRTKRTCNKQIVEEAHSSMVDQLSLLFISLTESLSNTKIGFLKAVLSGEEKLSSAEVIKKYRLGTSANVARIKKSLIDKEIVELEEDRIVFQDPAFAFWLKRYYFKINQS
jgi:uncharacterized protein